MNKQEKYEMRKTMVHQIGGPNIMAISGGRVEPIDMGIDLPVSNGYRVRVEYDEGMDTYTVSRIFKRSHKEFVRGRAENVYCDQLGEMAYRAGMFHSFSETEWMA